MKKKLLFRADGNAKIGLGHLYRVFALIEFYKNDFEFIFITQIASTTAIFPKEFKVEFIPENILIIDEPKWLAKNYNPKEFILIADGYQFNSNYQKKIKAFNFTLLYVDDLVSGHYFADVVINHSPKLNPTDFSSEDYTEFALGTKFAMLRPNFNNAAKENRKIDKIKNIFICFGGSDFMNLSLKATKALLEIEEIEIINVVLGGAYTDLQIFELCKSNNKLKIYKNIDEFSLVNILKSCQLAIAPSSTILYEICSVKMPVLSGFYVDNQKNIYNSFKNLGAIIAGGDFSNYTENNFKNEINQILKLPNFDSFLERQKELFDGGNRLRFLGILNKQLLTCRKVAKRDLETIFEWSNDVLVRTNSYNSEEISIENHTKWFLNKIKDKNVLFLIIQINKIPAGLVRFEILDNYSVVGILVSKKYRGQKLSVNFLKLAINEYFNTFKKPIHAYIKEENKASVKTFINAGFSFYKNEKVKNSDSFVYKLE